MMAMRRDSRAGQWRREKGKEEERKSFFNQDTNSSRFNSSCCHFNYKSTYYKIALSCNPTSNSTYYTIWVVSIQTSRLAHTYNFELHAAPLIRLQTTLKSKWSSLGAKGKNKEWTMNKKGKENRVSKENNLNNRR